MKTNVARLLLVWIWSCQVAYVTATSHAASSWKSFLARFRPGKLNLDSGLPKIRHLARNQSKGRDVIPFLPKGDKDMQSSSSTPPSEAEINLNDYLPRKRPRQQLQPHQLHPILREWWDKLPPSFQEPRTWGRWIASGLQWGLVVYLIHAVYKVRQK